MRLVPTTANHLRLLAEDVRVTGIEDAQAGDTEVLTAGSAEVVVVSSVVVDTALGEYRVVLELGLAEGRAVGGDDHQLGLASAQLLKGRLVAEGELSVLDHEGETGVDGLSGLFRLLGRNHGGCGSPC